MINNESIENLFFFFQTQEHLRGKVLSEWILRDNYFKATFIGACGEIIVIEDTIENTKCNGDNKSKYCSTCVNNKECTKEIR